MVLRLALGSLLVGGLLAGAPAGEAATPVSTRGCPSGQVSLTFDDGPSRDVTPSLVRVLRRADVPATFFMVGERVAAAPDVARAVDRAGFVVANHTYRHAAMTTQSTSAIRTTLRTTQRQLLRAGTRPTRLMRPPYGAIDDRVRRAVADVDMVPVLWDVDPRDWEDVSGATIASRVLAGLRVRQRNIVLLHDGIRNSPATLAAVPRIVAEARRRGYCFVALDDAGNPGFRVPRADLRVTGAREGRAARAVVTLQRHTHRATSVRLTTRGPGTGKAGARSGEDFERRDVVVRFPAGATRRVVRIPLLRDGLDERRERFEVRLSRPHGVTLGRATGVARIEDTDPPPRVRIRDAAVVEPTTDPAVVEVVVSLAEPSGRTVRLRVVDVAGTATGEDYLPVDVRLRIPAGQRRVVVPVTVLPDALEEPEETFGLRITRAENARVARGEAVVTVGVPEPPPDPPVEPPAEPPPDQPRR